MAIVQIGAGLAIDRNSSNQGTTAVGIRRAQAGFVEQSSPGVVAPGRFSSDHFVVSGTGAMAYAVSAGNAVLTRATQGAYIVGSHQNVTVGTDPTGGVNPRYDRIYLHQPDPALDGGGVDVRTIIGVAVGTPGASPDLPDIPPGALELARALVPASAGATSGFTFTDIAPVTGLALGSKTTVRAKAGLLSGTAAPTSALGENGDIYFQRL